MRMQTLLSTLIILSITVLSLLVTQLAYADNNPGPADTVLAFNKAVTDSKLVDLLDTFATGGVQFTVKASHMGQTPDGLTADLKSYWTMIGPVIFSSTKSYTRKANILDTKKTATMATVWAEVETNSVRIAGGSQKNKFKEIYLLLQTEKGWKIAGIMDTKQLSTLRTPNN